MCSVGAGSAYNISARVPEALDAISTRSFTYDYEFHIAVTQAIEKARDPHLAYRLPCYTIFASVQPFKLGKFVLIFQRL